jgi:hypothetical protein
MSYSNVPTIPFVLPLYQEMENYLEAVSVTWEHLVRIQHTAKQGFAELRKYSTPTKTAPLLYSWDWSVVSHAALSSLNCDPIAFFQFYTHVYGATGLLPLQTHTTQGHKRRLSKPVKIYSIHCQDVP